MHPLKIEILKKNILAIKWNDQRDSKIGLLKLRKLCPCATCVTEKEKLSKSYIPLYSGNQLAIKNIKQVGSYAISISWQDGHNTGIYEYSFLRSLEEE